MSNNIPDPILRKEKYLAKIAENTAGGGSDPVILQANKNITANGIVNPNSGFDGFAKVTVNVPNTYSAADEGKVVSDGALISQVSTSVTTNDTYDTTYYNEVTVNVPNTYTAQDEGKVVDNGALVSQTSTNITSNGTVNTTTNNEVVVAVPNTYTAGDEGKVVNSGALVAQTAYPSTVTVNDTYDTTNYNSITVNVPSGGGSVEEKDVNFYDYDGTLLYSYTAQEFLALTEMPANPDRTSEGLIAQGWNWSFADAQSYVTDNVCLNVGQYYVTTDGYTKIYFTIPSDFDLTKSIYLYTGLTAGSIDVDWGDGISERLTLQSGGVPHTYSSVGDYVISYKVITFPPGITRVYISGRNYMGTPNASGWSWLLHDGSFSNTPSFKPSTWIKRIEFGEDNHAIGEYGLAMVRLSTITISNNVKISVPNYSGGNVSDRGGICGGDSNLKFLVIPDLDNNTTSTNLCSYTFSNCSKLKGFTTPKDYTVIGTEALTATSSMLTQPLPPTVTHLNGLSAKYKMTQYTIPPFITSMNSNTFYYSYNLKSIKFTSNTPPTVPGLLTFWNDDTIIYVPTGTLTAYTTAANYPDPNTYTYIEY